MFQRLAVGMVVLFLLALVSQAVLGVAVVMA
jgi:hypothetical protein